MAEAAAKKDVIERKGRIREVVFGMQDGLISTVGFVAGVHSATADHWLVLLAGLVEMFSGAVSMAAGAYLSGRAEVEVYQRAIEEERQRFMHEPYLASEELLQTMMAEGLSREKAYGIIKLMQGEGESLLKTFQEKVLGLANVNPDIPITSALVIGVWFALGAAIPLLPYLFFTDYTSLWIAFICSGLALFGIGVAKAVLANKSWWHSGLEFLLIATGAAGLGYLFGRLLPAS
jgi:VIT1/CCC1 family predicted Fe2+/Mn2+ transporter